MLQKPGIEYLYFSGSGAMQAEIGVEETWEMVGFDLTLTALGSAENLTVTRDTAVGSAWDINIYKKDMDAIEDLAFFWRVGGDKGYPMNKGDKAVFAWDNSGNAGWGLCGMYRRRN